MQETEEDNGCVRVLQLEEGTGKETGQGFKLVLILTLNSRFTCFGAYQRAESTKDRRCEGELDLFACSDGTSVGQLSDETVRETFFSESPKQGAR